MNLAMNTIFNEPIENLRRISNNVRKTFAGSGVKFETLGDFCCAGKVLTEQEANLLKIACYFTACEIQMNHQSWLGSGEPRPNAKA